MVRYQEDHGGGGGAGNDAKQLSRRRRTQTANADEDFMRDVNALLQGDGKGDVKAFVLMTLRPSNVVDVAASRAIQPSVQPLLQAWSEAYLPKAYQSAGFIEQAQDDDDKSSVTAEPVASTTGHTTPTPLTHTLTQTQEKDRRDLKRLACGKPRDWFVDSAFRIDDKLKVTKTMLTLLWYVQQNTLKVVAKAWIKGICPRKQTKFPYRNKARERQGRQPELPPWWPTKGMCLFKEPDHIDTKDRLAFHVFVLRLRPSVEDLLNWNHEEGNPRPTMRTHTEHRWTEFLQELAPLSLIGDAGPIQEKKVAHRRTLFQALYDLAGLEEQYLNGEIDGDHLVQPLDAELRKKIIRNVVGKRTRQNSAESSPAESEANDTDEGAAPAPSKKVKTTRAAPKPKAAVAPQVSKGKQSKTIASRATTPQTVNFADTKAQSQVHWQEPLVTNGADGRSSTTCAGTPAAINTSFSSAMSDVSSVDMPVFTPASPFPDMTPGLQQGVQCHPVYGIPHPAFETMPNTPEHMPFDNQGPVMGHDMAALSLCSPAAYMQQDMPNFAQQQPPHGLPSQWPITQQMQPFTYEVEQGVPSAYAQHAGFVGTPDVPTGPHMSSNFYPPPPPFRGQEDTTPDDQFAGLYHFGGPNRDVPPASLPASVVRGFTGHASGVGDSAKAPPTDTFYGYDFTTSRLHDDHGRSVRV